MDKMTKPMVDFYYKRTREHIDRVQKYISKIRGMNFKGVDPVLLTYEKMHDLGKYHEPELTPYVYLTWRYKTAKDPLPYIPSDDVAKEIDKATFHHVTTHKHHPEYWDKSATQEMINSDNRDEPSDVMVNATSMPLTYIASMMADWLSMSEEKNTNVNDWIKKNVNIRWKFTPEQVALINEIAKKVKVDKNAQ